MVQLLQNALCGTALILAAALLRRILKGRFLPEARLVLWALCLFRLLAPAGPASALSLWGLLGGPHAPAATQPPLSIPPVSSPLPVSPPQVQVYAPSPAFPAPQPAGFPWKMALAAVWLGVGLALAVRYALSWRRTRRAVKGAAPIPRPDPRYLPLPRCARLREGAVDGAPLTFGTVRPTVVLTPGLSGAELECVLAHEGVHARRGDNVWHYAMALALTVYWWNPAVWLMARLLRRDIELSCDRAAVKKLGLDRRADYARALVSLAAQGEGSAFSRPFGQKLTEERIVMIMKYKKPALLSTVLTLLLVLSLSVTLGTSPAAAAPAPDPALDAQPTLTEDEILCAEMELLMADIEQEFFLTQASPTAQSTCSHPSLSSGQASTATVCQQKSASEHRVYTKVYRRCPDCYVQVCISDSWTDRPHSFGAQQYVSVNHTSPNPSDHFITFGHTCTGCSFYTTYTAPSGCTRSGCVNPYSVTPQSASDHT